MKQPIQAEDRSRSDRLRSRDGRAFLGGTGPQNTTRLEYSTDLKLARAQQDSAARAESIWAINGRVQGRGDPVLNDRLFVSQSGALDPNAPAARVLVVRLVHGHNSRPFFGGLASP